MTASTSSSSTCRPISGVLASEVRIGCLPGGRTFATCVVFVSEPIGHGLLRTNPSWPVVVHRTPAIELLRAALQGDVLEMWAVEQDGWIIVPRSAGRVDVLLCS